MSKKLTADQLSLLLYLETRAVDHGGRVDGRHMNTEDFEQAETWGREGLIEFGRIASADLCLERGAHWVVMSEAAWTAAHVERRARAKRMWARRKFSQSKELREGRR